MARSRNTEPPAGMIDATALVVQCEAPPQGMFGLLNARNNFIRVVVDAGRRHAHGHALVLAVRGPVARARPGDPGVGPAAATGPA